MKVILTVLFVRFFIHPVGYDAFGLVCIILSKSEIVTEHLFYIIYSRLKMPLTKETYQRMYGRSEILHK